MKRKYISPLLMLAMLFPFAHTANAATYPDVPESSEYFYSIEYFTEIGAIQGYDVNGTSYFKPDQMVNRAEAVKIIMAGAAVAYDTDVAVSQAVFQDVQPGVWYTPYVKVAKDAGIVKGNDDTGLFVPDRMVNKAELVKMVIQANNINLTTASYSSGANFASDVTKDQWFYDYMHYAHDYGIIFADKYGDLDPGKNLTRGEVMEIMYNTVKMFSDGDVQQKINQAEAMSWSAHVKLGLQDYAGAVADADKAVAFIDDAVLLESDEPFIQEVQKVVYAFSAITEGFYAWKVNNDPGVAIAKAEQAESYINDLDSLEYVKQSSLDALILALKTAK